MRTIDEDVLRALLDAADFSLVGMSEADAAKLKDANGAEVRVTGFTIIDEDHTKEDDDVDGTATVMLQLSAAIAEGVNFELKFEPIGDDGNPRAVPGIPHKFEVGVTNELDETAPTLTLAKSYETGTGAATRIVLEFKPSEKLDATSFVAATKDDFTVAAVNGIDPDNNDAPVSLTALVESVVYDLSAGGNGVVRVVLDVGTGTVKGLAAFNANTDQKPDTSDGAATGDMVDKPENDGTLSLKLTYTAPAADDAGIKDANGVKLATDDLLDDSAAADADALTLSGADTEGSRACRRAVLFPCW